jgi:hypothetical protein
MMYSIRCRQCATTVVHDHNQLQGCRCDPDATSWVAIGKDGRLIKMSGSNIEVLKADDETNI